MAGSTVKMGVDVTQFKQGMREAQSAVKTLDAELKKNEAQFKATGDKETYMAQKSKLLKAELEQQRTAAKNAENALKAMAESGVSKTSEAYQRMAQQLAGAQAAMYNTEAALNSLSTSETKAASGAKNLTDSMNSIGKKISLEQVITGIDKITSGMERAAQKAVELGKAIWDNIMDSAQWSDDTATQAMILDMSIEQYQRYKGVFDTIGELSVRDWMTAKRKVEKAIIDPSSDQIDVLKALGFVRTVNGKYGEEEVSDLADNWEQVFWDAAKALQSKVETGQISQEMADVYGEALFGKKFSNLKPLMKLGQEGFMEALNEQVVASEEAIEKNAALNDAVIKLQNSYDALKAEVTSGLAPALQSAAEALDSLLGSIMEYLQTPEGKEMLESLGKAVSGLFDDLGKIDPESVVSGFVDLFTKLTDGIKWLVDNKDSVVTALEVIAGGFALLKVSEGVLTFMKLLQGAKGLFGGGGGGGTGVGSGGPDILTTGGAGGILKYIAPALKAVAPYAAGAAISAAAFYGIAKYATANNYTFQGDYNSARYADVDNPHQLQTAIRGILSSNDKNAQWQLGYLSAHAGSAQELFDLFNYNDAKLGETNWLLNVGGTNPQMAAAVYSMYAHRFGGLNTETFNGLPAEWRSMLIGGQEAYGNIQASGGQMDYTWLLSGMRQYFEHYGTFNEEGEWTIPGLEESSSSMDAAAEAMNGAAEAMSGLPAEVAAAVSGVTLQVTIPEHANGLFSVPWDGYPAILHKGERVLTARENQQYTYNNYFGNVNLNNGLEIEALTESIDRRNRRQRSGYGAS